MFLANQVADALAGLAEVQQAVGRRALAQLVVQTGERDVVALPEGAVVVHPPLRHEEERDSLGPRGAARDLGQHEMRDVVRDLLVPARDPHPGPGQRIGPVAARFGLRADVGQGGARLGLLADGRRDAIGQDDPAVLVAGLLCVRFGGDREEVILGDLLCRVEDLPDRLAAPVGVTVGLEQGVEVEELVEQEIELAAVDDQGHGGTSVKMSGEAAPDFPRFNNSTDSSSAAPQR